MRASLASLLGLAACRDPADTTLGCVRGRERFVDVA